MTTRSDVSAPRRSETREPATRRIVALLKSAYAIFSEKKAAGHGAAIAFYIVTSIAPVILIVIAVAGFALGGTRCDLRPIPVTRSRLCCQFFAFSSSSRNESHNIVRFTHSADVIHLSQEHDPI
jgi:hypothetical protein